ncbi:MAG: phospholipid carrier-dependent glycosyltransferase [Anaerolineales bacterium]|nr:MAG: phospholipid carrier-dependent glycosyltransferase [Anaerolineales bacterium]
MQSALPAVNLMTSRQSFLASLLILGLLAGLGTFLVLYATPQGLALSDDSIAYIAGARSILGGDGYRAAWLASNKPVTHFPPGFSSVLALVGLSGLDPLRGTRFVNSLLFGTNIFLLGLIGWRMTRSQIAGIVLAFLFLVNASLFRVHTAAMSEPLYIFFTLASFLSFSRYFGTQQLVDANAGAGSRTPTSWLFLTAVLTAFAYLTRYAGLALLATFGVALILLHDTWHKRLVSAGTFLAGFIPFALAWSIRNRLLADSATNRTVVYHPITLENIQMGIYNFSVFLMPFEEWRRALMRIPNFFAALLIFIVSVLLIWMVLKGLKKFFKPATEMTEVLSFINTLYVFGYLSSLIVTMTWFDAATKFQLRIVAPVFVSLLIMLAFFGVWLWQKQKTLWRAAVIVLALCIFTLSVQAMSGTMAQLRKGGQGYASFRWFDSEAMQFLRGLPEGARIYSNQVGPVYLYTGRAGYVLPDRVDAVTGLPRGRYEEGIAELQQDVLSGEAVLALFRFGAADEDVQSVYMDISNGLYLAHDTRGDKIYTAFP